jgi:hypothetical protein
LNNREATEKIAKWAIELSMYDIIYKPRTKIKAQTLSDFVAKWTEIRTPPKEWELEYWSINFDGSLQLQGATQQVWENMTYRLTTRMAKLGFDSQKAVVNIYALMLLFTRRSSSSNWTSQQRTSSSNWTTRQWISSSN